VYYKLIYGDGNQGFLLNESNFKINKAVNTQKVQIINRKFTLSEAELAEHRDFLEKNIKNPLWLSDEIKENA
jgi:hypothetical protein